MRSQRSQREWIESRAGRARISRRPGGITRARKGACICPIEAVFAVGAHADSRQLICMLSTVTAVEAASAVAEGAVQSRAGTRGIALPAGEIGRFVRSRLHRQDR